MSRTPEQVADRIRLTHELTRVGYSARQIAIRLGVTTRQVVRYRTGKVAGTAGNRHRLDSAQLQPFAEAVHAGATHAELEARFYLSYTSVTRRKAKLRADGLLGCCQRANCPNARDDEPCIWSDQ